MGLRLHNRALSTSLRPFLAAGAFWLACTPAFAVEHKPSGSLLGSLGLNTVPSARMDAPGTIRASVSTLDPYMHGSLGLQIAEPLFIAMRQSAETSTLHGDPDRLYPGLDIKLRLLEEDAYQPEISLGLQSAIGHKRMAGEYIVLSKRYKDLDFTFGLGWGRLGSAAHLDNPFKIFGDHFGDARSLDGEMPSGPDDWFTGSDIGLFGGVEYFLPLDGFSLKLDYNADAYKAEHAALDFSRPSPWGASLNYAYRGASASLGMQGSDKIMGRISLQGSPARWPFAGKDYEDPAPFYPKRGIITDPVAMKNAAAQNDIALSGTEENDSALHARLQLTRHAPAPQQVGRAARAMATHGGPDAERLGLTPMILNLRGPTVHLIRSDLERALAHHQGSPEELWDNAEITYHDGPAIPMETGSKNQFYFTLNNQFSLSEEDNGLLYRTALLGHGETPLGAGFTAGGAVRLNLADNLEKLATIRPPTLLPVRSDVDSFTEALVSIERSYLNWMRTLDDDLHVSVTGGLLEEMYAGLGGEILYRPFDSRWALGAEAWQVFRRDPGTTFHTGLNGDHVLSGHVNAWYDVPHHNITLHAQAGRYLAEDIGGMLELEKIFDNGAKMSAFLTVTNQADADLFGGTTHAHHGLALTLPLGSVHHIPDGSAVDFKAEPFGRNTGQRIDAPLRLYALTENFTLDSMAKFWGDILD